MVGLPTSAGLLVIRQQRRSRNVSAGEVEGGTAIVLVQFIDGVGIAPTHGNRVLPVEIDGLFGVEAKAIVIHDGVLHEPKALSGKRADGIMPV